MATEAVETKTGSLTPEQVRARRDKLAAAEKPWREKLAVCRNRLADIADCLYILQHEVCGHQNTIKRRSPGSRRAWRYECADCGGRLSAHEGAVEVVGPRAKLVADLREPAEGSAT